MYRLTTRSGSSVERERHDSLDEALHALERQGREIERTADAKPVGGALMRRIEPARQVLARLELRGHGVSGGVDVRGDGSSEAFVGRLRRRLVEPRAGESSYDALRRALDA